VVVVVGVLGGTKSALILTLQAREPWSGACRDVWRYFAVPGTFRALLWACWSAVRGQGFHLALHPTEAKCLEDRANEESSAGGLTDDLNWYDGGLGPLATLVGVSSVSCESPANLCQPSEEGAAIPVHLPQLHLLPTSQVRHRRGPGVLPEQRGGRQAGDRTGEVGEDDGQGVPGFHLLGLAPHAAGEQCCRLLAAERAPPRPFQPAGLSPRLCLEVHRQRTSSGPYFTSEPFCPCLLQNGKTEYKSVTVAFDATAEEFMDFYLDDPTRPKWVRFVSPPSRSDFRTREAPATASAYCRGRSERFGASNRMQSELGTFQLKMARLPALAQDQMVTEFEILESGDASQRCQVVRWIRSFPFSFISDREYIIGRRTFRRNGCIYGITKSIEHPRAVRDSGVVRMDVFYSMWRRCDSAPKNHPVPF
jgi:hypothetical protein